MGCLIAPTVLMNQNGLAALTVIKLVLSPVPASLDPVPKCVTLLPHVLTCGTSRSPHVRSIMPPVLGILVRMTVGVFLYRSFVTQS